MNPEKLPRGLLIPAIASLIAWVACVACIACIACMAPPPPIAPQARAFAEADGLFRSDPRWLGADAALSVPLAPDRILWLFGDTFVATSQDPSRAESVMVRNTVAIQTGRDPRAASMTFHWGLDEDGAPRSFFPEEADRWYWPGHGMRLEEGPLVLFLYVMIATPENGLGFATSGYAIAVIETPDAPPGSWSPRIAPAPADPFDAVPATAVVRDGEDVIAVAIRQEGTHAGALVRFPAASLMAGDTKGARWWGGSARGWLPAPALGPEGPAFVLDDAGAECSLHRDDATGMYVHVASYGFGASTIGLRTAASITGPWSPPITVYRPPESDAPRPFVYAAKAHPGISGPDRGALIVTYATNSFDFDDLLTPEGERTLYWPRFVLVRTGLQ